MDNEATAVAPIDAQTINGAQSSTIYKLRYELSNIHRNAVTCAKISPDGKYIATCSSDCTVKVYHMATGKFKIRYQGHSKGVSDICWSPNSTYIASASDDNTIRIWSLNKPNSIKILKGHSYTVNCVRFNYKGNLLISGSSDEAIRIWDVQRGRCLKTLSAHSDPISSVDITWDGTVLASGSYDGLIRLFDVISGQCLKTLMYEKTDSSFPISYVKFSPNGKYLLSSSLDGIIRLWNYTTNKVVKTYKVSRLQHDINGKIDSTGSLENTLEENQDNLAKEAGNILSIAEKFCCGTEFITATKSPLIASGTEHGTIILWDLDTKTIQTVLQTSHKSPVLQIDIINNGAVMVSTSMEGFVQIWDLVKQL